MSSTQAAQSEFMDGGKPTAQPIYVVDVAGNPLSSGQGFTATSGLLATQTNNNLLVGGISIFNPSNSGKSLLIYSLQVFVTGGAFVYLRATTADAALGQMITPLPNNLGSPSVSVATVNSSVNNVTTGAAGTGAAFAVVSQTGSSETFDALTNGATILLPKSVSTGIAVYPFVATAGNQFAVNARWIEY